MQFNNAARSALPNCRQRIKQREAELRSQVRREVQGRSNGNLSLLTCLSLGEVPIGDLAAIHEHGVAAGLQSFHHVSEEVDPVGYS